MKELTTLPVLICLFISPVLPAESQQPVRVVRISVQSTLKEKQRSCHLADDLYLQIQGGNISVNLHLRHEPHQDTIIPIPLLERKANGQLVSTFWQLITTKWKSYEDVHRTSSFDVRCSMIGSRPLYRISGFLMDRGELYSLNPASSGASYRHLHHLVPFVGGSNTKKIEYNQHHSHSLRHRRQTTPEYKIDVLVIVDYQLFQHWRTVVNRTATIDQTKAAIKTYIGLVFRGVNVRFATISAYNINVSIVDIIISETATSPTAELTSQFAMRNNVNANSTLYALRNYVASNPLPENDHVMLFTGYDILGTDNGVLFKYTKGQAFVGTLCEGGRSVSVVEDHAGFQSVHSATHELAHSMNATHDGDDDPSCSSRDRYLMAGQPVEPTELTKANPWRFSSCSMQQMANFFENKLKQGRQSCLLNHTPSVPTVNSPAPGQLFSPDQQCKHIGGQMSYYCKGPSFSTVSDICTSMFCYKSTGNENQIRCNEHHGADGTSCGNKKWCEQGRCVESEDAPVKVDDCVFGDETGVTVNGKPCRAAVAETPYACYRSDIQQRCCGSCGTIQSTSPGCKYGDKLPGCVTRDCHSITPNGNIYDNDCCGTCNFSVNAWQCRDVSTDGLDCSSIQPYECYRPSIAFSCCSTCASHRNVDKTGCEYGDKQQRCDILSNYGKECSTDRQVRENCCQTCSPDVNSAHVMTSSFAAIFLLLITRLVHACQYD
ncbi:A disintegrin and metalloproteinase with thrombospondin motifs 19-like [Haliotis rubra]|uniref:A disintegrin and metalloproteinase with thrombospondin motifs 19-like n=1 Tax=Haliotis rubra TaxID=36100 RepID=UPI001EE5D374|nr:A disintegrin and metalloproteinase with thrombospondin motifs 19-like [Haliotis rubra]